jgi:hypothetical protein
MKRVSVLAVFMLAGTVAYGQANTCTYTFTFPEHSFQFCLTSVGTLAMLQSPIGMNHLDTVNPIEGWTWGLAGTVPGAATCSSMVKTFPHAALQDGCQHQR